MKDHDIDPDRDADLRRLLQRESAEPPFDDVDWAALHARVTADAEPVLAGMRAGHARVGGPAGNPGRTRPKTAWQTLAVWSIRGMPVAATAAAAMIVVVGTGALPERPGADDTDVSDAAYVSDEAYAYITIEEELAYGSAAFTAAGGDSDAVLDALLFQDEEIQQ